MKILRLLLFVALAALIPLGLAQDQPQTAPASLEGQISAAGEELQKKAAQHLLEGNLTTDHIAGEINETIDKNLNQTAELIKTRAQEEIKKEIAKQPGFEAASAAFAALIVLGLFRRRG